MKLTPLQKAEELVKAIEAKTPTSASFNTCKVLAILMVDEIIIAINSTGRMVKEQVDYYGEVKLEINGLKC